MSKLPDPPANAMEYAGCYVLSLYCCMYYGHDRSKATHDTVDGVHSITSFAATFTGETKAGAIQAAQHAGWAVYPLPRRLAICPRCRRKHGQK